MLPGFTSTETVGLLGTGAQDGPDFHTAAPELCTCFSSLRQFAVQLKGKRRSAGSTGVLSGIIVSVFTFDPPPILSVALTVLWLATHPTMLGARAERLANRYQQSDHMTPQVLRTGPRVANLLRLRKGWGCSSFFATPPPLIVMYTTLHHPLSSPRGRNAWGQ